MNVNVYGIGDNMFWKQKALVFGASNGRWKIHPTWPVMKVTAQQLKTLSFKMARGFDARINGCARSTAQPNVC